MNFFSMNGVPEHYTNWNFPGFFDEGEAHTAWCMAENDVGIGPHPTEVEQALIEKLIREIARRCPQIRPEHMQTGFRRFCEYVMELDRAHLVGPPLRLTWFRLSYFLGLYVFGDAGRPLPESVSTADVSSNLIQTLRELGIEATESDLADLSQMFRLKSQQDEDARRERFRLGIRKGTMLHYLRFLHLSAVRHQSVIRLPYVVGEVALIFAAEDAKKATQAQTYLQSHAVLCVDDLAQAETVIAFLSRDSAADASFWSRLATAKQAGCRPSVLLDCPRSELSTLEQCVPDGFDEVFDWVIQTTIVEYVPDNKTGFISLLRGLEPGTRWWWGDDAIPDVMASDGFELFDGALPQKPGGGMTDTPYPAIAHRSGIDAGVALAERVFAELEPAARVAPASHHDALKQRTVALMDTRATFDGEFFHLPWFMIGYLLTHRMLSLTMIGRVTPWHAEDLDPLSAALHGLGLHSKHGDIPDIFEKLLACEWRHGLETSSGRAERVAGFSRLVMAFSDMALRAYSKTRFVVPLHTSFVSYAAQERDFADHLSRTIEKTQTAEVWFDGRAVSMGRQLTEVLRRGIDQSERLVLLASAASASSDFVRLETDYAVAEGKPIVVLPIGDALDPAWLSAIAQWREQGLTVDVLPNGLNEASAVATTIASLTRSPQEAAAWVASAAAEPLHSGSGCA